MPFVGRSMQAMAAPARAALSRDEMLVGTLSCGLSLVAACLEDELDGLDPSFTSLHSRKSLSLPSC
jgi:hypothetical protein